MEYAQLSPPCWSHEAERGQRGYIIPEDTIVWVEHKLGSEYVIVVETSNSRDVKCTKLSWVLSRMREERAAPRLARHTLNVTDTRLPHSTFVRVKRGTAHLYEEVDHGLP